MTPHLIARASGLCFVAGYVDAIGYTQLGNVFAANMTGNSVLFAVAAVRGEFAHAASYGVTLAAFIAGAVISALMKRMTGRAAVPLVTAALLVAAGLVTAPPNVLLALLAMTMGFQGAAVSRFGPTNLQTVVVTGTLVRLAEYGVDRLFPSPARAPEPGAIRLHAAAWLVYGLGAAVAIAMEHVTPRPLLVAAIVLLLVTADVAHEERAAG